jgi:hypothetical protein
MKSIKEIQTEFLEAGLSQYQSLRKAKNIFKWNGKSELGSGMIYNELRSIGIGILESYRIEAFYWAYYDTISPPTPYERGFINFIEGKSKKKYNQINLMNF